MGKWIAITAAVLAVWIGFRFARFGVRTADLRSAAAQLLASVERGGEDRSVEVFAGEARKRGFDVDPASIEVTVRPTDRESGMARFVPGSVARMVREEVRLVAPVRYRVAGPLVRTTTIDVSDIRIVEIIGYSSVDANPELAGDLGAAPHPDPRPPPAGGGGVSSPRRPRGVYEGAKQRARDLTR